MTSPEPGAPAAVPAPLLEGRFDGRNEFSELIRQALTTAAAQGWREIILCDPDFEDWPLGVRAVVQALNDWSRRGGKLTMLARNYDTVLRRHARFVTWRQTWSHAVECRKSARLSADSLPSALWSPGWMFERLDLARSTGVAGSEARRRLFLKERLSERLLGSSPAFPATILGL
ncbi:MAG: hypothetical protein JWR60_1860 [Polaromonas sp.]|nr:hypothetical protein [Polaromonas sp.]